MILLSAQQYPTKLTVSSTGITKDLQSYVFGEYEMVVGNCVNEKPVWQQGAKEKYISDPTDQSWWWIVPDPNQAWGWVQSVEKGLTEIPTTGWKVSNPTSSTWIVDSELTIEKSTSTAALITASSTNLNPRPRRAGELTRCDAEKSRSSFIRPEPADSQLQ